MTPASIDWTVAANPRRLYNPKSFDPSFGRLVINLGCQSKKPYSVHILVIDYICFLKSTTGKPVCGRRWFTPAYTLFGLMGYVL
jgi:hypothetical protein